MSRSFLKFLLVLITVIQISAQEVLHFNKAYDNILKTSISTDFFSISSTDFDTNTKKSVKEINNFGQQLSEENYFKTNSSEQSENFQKTRNWISIAKDITIIILLASLICILLYFKAKQKQKHSKFKHIIRNQQRSINQYNNVKISTEHTEPDFSHISVEEVGDNNEDAGKKRNESLMTSETEIKLLELLDDFEKGDLFNNKNMSLPFLAGELNTNTKYLSYVINQHKSTDFKSYINRLRINYIVDKIINDEKYRQYKISILADECGFSSHSKFASVFKAVTDLSPSAYIKMLDSEAQKNNNNSNFF